jgi:hypothetical protein
MSYGFSILLSGRAPPGVRFGREVVSAAIDRLPEEDMATGTEKPRS